MINLRVFKGTLATLSIAFATLVFSPVAAAAEDDKDKNGNVVEFSYGGDETFSYADGKVGTGKKDPKVCGSFQEAKCSVAHLKGK